MEEVFFAFMDIFFVIQDWILGWVIFGLFAQTGHIKWAVAAGGIIILPGLAIMIGLTFDDQSHSRRKYLWRFLTVLAFPTIIVKIGSKVIYDQGRGLLRLRHMKSYDGLLQSGFMFFMQLVVLFTRPSMGTLYGIPDGRFWILVIGLTSSLLNLLRDVTLYHIVSDGEASNLRRQIKLVPYYLIHLAFRSLALATFFIYWKELAILTIVPLVIFNMWLTRHTYKLPTNSDEQHHLHFCTVVGGWSSFMVPSLSTFFGQTTSTRSLNYHYKRNILATNLLFGLVFACLITHMNVGPESSGKDRLKRNHLLSCHDGEYLTKAELSLSSLPCPKGTVNYIHKDDFLGQRWWMMLPCAPKVSIKECPRGAKRPKNIRNSPSCILQQNRAG